EIPEGRLIQILAGKGKIDLVKHKDVFRVREEESGEHHEGQVASPEPGHNSLEFKTRGEVIQRLKDPEFPKLIAREDIHFKVTGETLVPGVTLSMEGAIRTILNLLATKIEIQDTPENPRRVTLDMINAETGKSDEWTLWQWNREEQGFELISVTTPTPEKSRPFSSTDTLPELPPRLETMSSGLAPSQALPVITSMDHIDRLPLLLKRVHDDKLPDHNPQNVILEPSLLRGSPSDSMDLDVVYLSKLTQGLGKDLQGDILFTLLVPANRQTYPAFFKEQKLQGRQLTYLFWQQAALRVLVR
ncbi:MAG: hypothetical protein R3257_07725, partial [bacterium]|nr:hypothetical protein [bacterium]